VRCSWSATIRWQTGYSAGIGCPGFTTRHVNADRLPPGALPSPEAVPKPAKQRRRRLSEAARDGWSFLGRCISRVSPLSGNIWAKASSGLKAGVEASLLRGYPITATTESFPKT